MDIQEWNPDDLNQLRLLTGKEPLTKQRDWHRAVSLALEGQTATQITSALGRSCRFVQRWCYAYRDGGIKAITPRRQTGRAARLPTEKNNNFKQRLLDGPQRHDTMCTLRG